MEPAEVSIKEAGADAQAEIARTEINVAARFSIAKSPINLKLMVLAEAIQAGTWPLSKGCDEHLADRTYRDVNRATRIIWGESAPNISD